MRHGIPGRNGSGGNEESASCRSYSRIENPNSSLSASLESVAYGQSGISPVLSLEVEPNDPATLADVGLLFLGEALLACWEPPAALESGSRPIRSALLVRPVGDEFEPRGAVVYHLRL